MTPLARRAEILKLARVLSVAPERLQFMAALEPATIRALRERATASLFDAEVGVFRRIASASGQLPAGLCAMLAERAFGPLLCAKLTALLPPDRAVDIARRLHRDFLADLCLQLDPRAAQPVLAAMPTSRIVEVARVLAQRGEHITMGRFVDSMGDAAVQATAAALDDASLLRIGLFVESDARLSAVIASLSPQRLQGLVRAAVDGDAELWQEAVMMIHRVDEPVRRRLADVVAELEQADIERMIAASHAQALWPEMLGVIAIMNPANQRRLMELALLQDEAILGSAVSRADEQGLWPHLLALQALLEQEGRERFAQIVSRHAPAAEWRLRGDGAAPRRRGKTALA
jgi:uncharacterized protein YecA (UPF0149 family)